MIFLSLQAGGWHQLYSSPVFKLVSPEPAGVYFLYTLARMAWQFLAGIRLTSCLLSCQYRFRIIGIIVFIERRLQ